MDLSELKIDILEKDQTYLFQVPETWGVEKFDQLEQLANGLRQRQIKGVVVVGELKLDKLKDIFDSAPEEKKHELLAALGYFFVNPLAHELTH
jgi:hypothetical protein